jgi:hypothetical protein
MATITVAARDIEFSWVGNGADDQLGTFLATATVGLTGKSQATAGNDR